MNRIWSVFLVFIFTIMPVMALDFDVSVDEEIKRKYDTNRIEYELPSLPKTSPTTSNSNSNNVSKPQNVQAPKISQVNNQLTAKKIQRWSTMKVVSSQNISDYMSEGTNLVFTLQDDWYGKYVKLPKGTKLYGKILRTHQPQFAGNGGSIVFRITSVSYNSKNYDMNARVTKANSKRIFLNNIKGERRYLKGISKQVDKGEKFFDKTSTVSSKLSDNPILFVLSPVPKFVGGVGFVVCTVLSPVTAVFTKGGNISIPSGRVFEIKLSENAFVE